MANTRPLRYGGVMNSGFPTPPPGVFDDEPPGWTNNAAAPSAASTHAVKPEPYSPPRMATPTAPAMSETLTQRKREMLKRCTDAAQQLGKPVLFGMTTSLILQSVPLPKDCDLNATELHTVSDSHRTRIRARRSANNTAHLETAKRRAQCTYQQACARAESGTYLGAARRSHVIGIIGHTWRRNPYGNSAQAEPIGRPQRRRNLSGLCAAGQRTSEIQRESHMHDRT